MYTHTNSTTRTHTHPHTHTPTHPHRSDLQSYRCYYTVHGQHAITLVSPPPPPPPQQFLPLPVPASLFTDLPRSSGSSVASRQLCNELCDPSEAPAKKQRTTGPVPTNIQGLQACAIEIYNGVANELDTDHSQCDTERAAYEDGKAAVPNNLSVVAVGVEGEGARVQITLSEASTSYFAENDFLRCDEVRCLFFPCTCACEKARLRQQGNSLLEK